MNGAHHSRSSQHGAALLMATVFLLVVIALFGLVSLRMAASDITDTSLQNDSVAALFLAESGAERALQRLGAGTACDELAEPGILHTLGRGDFEIQTAAIDASSGWCDVQVLGRVLLGGTPRAQRRIEASLQQGGGGPVAWAVGAGGAIYAWSGSSWSSVASPTSARLNAVHCVSSTECWAVGQNGETAHWIGGNWEFEDANTGENLLGVACIPGSPTACYAVGNDTVRRWNGNTWVSSGFSSGRLTGVSCTASTCYAVRDDGRIYERRYFFFIIEYWGLDDNLGGDYAWNGIDCLPGGECWAVADTTGNRFRFGRRQGGAWSPLTDNDTPTRDLYGISCPASGTCWAVGARQGGTNDTIVERSGGNFSKLSVAGGIDLFAIDCDTAAECLAVGDNGHVQGWNGASWSPATSGMGNVDLYGVAMTGASGGGSVQLMRWQEIIQ